MEATVDEPEVVIRPALTPLVLLAMHAPLIEIAERARGVLADDSGPLRQDYAGYARNIETAALHLLRLIDGLVTMGQPGDERLLEIKRIELDAVVVEACALTGLAARDATVELNPSLEPMIAAADKSATVQIVCNLITNAIRHAPAGSTVSIGMRREDRFSHIMVRDRGAGIAADDQERIFDKFVRLRPQDDGGSGLGLYLARGLARAMGGEVSVISSVGAGATFVLSLPLA